MTGGQDGRSTIVESGGSPTVGEAAGRGIGVEGLTAIAGDLGSIALARQSSAAQNGVDRLRNLPLALLEHVPVRVRWDSQGANPFLAGLRG